jgi:hypothetical protein
LRGYESPAYLAEQAVGDGRVDIQGELDDFDR